MKKKKRNLSKIKKEFIKSWNLSKMKKMEFLKNGIYQKWNSSNIKLIKKVNLL